MPEIKEKVQVHLPPILDRYGAFLVEVAVRNERGGKLIQVYADTDAGITIKECAQISRELGQSLDREGVIPGSYRLEVSSPGIDKPLRLLRQFRKNIGRRFKVVHEVAEGKGTIVGKLEAVADDKLTFETEDGEFVTLDFSRIIETKEELPW
jgi:ribosome maturation factor RimP